VKIEGSIGRGSAVDWIPIIEGFSLNNWAWWNSSWGYCRNLTVSTGITNYQYYVNLTNTTNMNVASLRFVNASCGDDGQEMYHWVEENTSSWISAWFKGDSTTGTHYSVYYDNSEASDNSDGENTFIFFDDFEDAVVNTTKWDVQNTSVATSTDKVFSGTKSLKFNDGGWLKKSLTNNESISVNNHD